MCESQYRLSKNRSQKGYSTKIVRPIPREPIFDHHRRNASHIRTYISQGLQNDKSEKRYYVLGLSAPRRKDGLDIFLRHCFGDPFVVSKIGSSVSRIQSVGRNTSSRRANADIQFKYPHFLAPSWNTSRIHLAYPMKMNRRTRKPDFNLFLRDIVDSQEQLSMMAHYVKTGIKDPLTTGVLVLSDQVQHLKNMKRLLQGEDAILLYGGQTKKQKEAGLRFENRITLSTFHSCPKAWMFDASTC